MIFARPPIRRTRTGRYAISLNEPERDLLADLANQLTQLLGNPDDATLMRLFPPAYQGAELAERADEYRRLMGDDLAASHGDALATLAQTARATELSEEEAGAWMRALNDLRLSLGTRLGIADDGDEIGVDTPEGQVYHLLGWLQESLVTALAGGL